MMPTEITFFAVTLFLALSTLLSLKRRHDLIQARLNMGLRGYVEKRSAPPAVVEQPAVAQPAAAELVTA